MNASSLPIRTRPLLLLAFALLCFLPACAEQTETGGEAAPADTVAAQQNRTRTGSPQQDSSIVQMIAREERFSTFATALDSGGLLEELRSRGPYTVFAPTNDAFDELPEGALDELLLSGSHDRLAAILSYHVVEGENRADALETLSSVTTLDGARMQVTQQGGSIVLNPDDGSSATVVETNIPASNGVIHVVDAVLMPPVQAQE